jgi:cell wall-associated NlpC family hydrolase
MPVFRHSPRSAPKLKSRALAIAATAVALLGTGLTAPTSADLRGKVATEQSAVTALKQQIAAETARIAATNNGLAAAQRRLIALEHELAIRTAALKKVQVRLLAARERLVRLENKLERADHALAANLVARYEQGTPDLMSALLQANGFGDLLNRINFLQRFAREDSQIVKATRVARDAVAREARRLGALEERDRQLANEVLAARNQEAALKAALLSRRVSEVRTRARNGSRLQTVERQLQHLQAQLAAAEARAAARARAAASTGNAGVGGIAVNTGGMVQPPPGAPRAVAEVIAAGNAIATLPYVWGGGHGSFHANGYDCSGSVSYALAAAGLVSSPMTSGMFESWGAPGPGRWITVYANAGHVWMEVAGWRFDTVALAEGGSRWSQGGGEFAGFVVRHPPGL